MPKPVLFLFSMTLTLGVTVASQVQANLYWKSSASNCFTKNPQNADTSSTGVVFNTSSSTPGSNMGLLNQNSSASANIYCPVQDDDRLPKTAVETAIIHPATGSPVLPNTTFTAQLCSAVWSMAGGSCGNAFYGGKGTTPFIVTRTVTPAAFSAWTATEANDFAYVKIVLPALTSINARVVGYGVQDF